MLIIEETFAFHACHTERQARLFCPYFTGHQCVMRGVNKMSLSSGTLGYGIHGIFKRAVVIKCHHTYYL